MSRQSRRLSRVLLAILLLSFSAVALSFIYKVNHQPAQSRAARPQGRPRRWPRMIHRRRTRQFRP